ncbi:hypothetical protein GPJ56_003877 [Histomonas meleagridis]|uniref:uncharacterized protein n=1 Tax=Histomonas meleagridis TaxID=135588 RepID=UPI003559733B|nr:hypothetical protein GPJ56_003877 [Histomonas meleagridis]KAH0805336.1 hypothetical protein GO595_002281 [Histomonas meleagridis]
MFQGAKTWKPFWVEVKDNFLNISTECGKEAFTSFHIGVLRVRPSKDYPDRPDVLELYDGDGFTATSFFVFTYDPFDILEFFKNVCNAYKSWRDNVTTNKTPIQSQWDVKPPGFFSGNVTWQVNSDRICVQKNNVTQSTIMLNESFKITPQWNQSKAGLFKLQRGNEVSEIKCANNTQMKELLNAIYTNAFILKIPAQPAQPAQPQAPAPEAAPAEPSPTPAPTPAPQETTE